MFVEIVGGLAVAWCFEKISEVKGSEGKGDEAIFSWIVDRKKMVSYIEMV